MFASCLLSQRQSHRERNRVSNKNHLTTYVISGRKKMGKWEREEGEREYCAKERDKRGSMSVNHSWMDKNQRKLFAVYDSDKSVTFK